MPCAPTAIPVHSGDRWSLTRAREWGPELRALEGGHNLPTANSAPMKARITKFLRQIGWLKIYIMCNFGDPRSISSGSKNQILKKNPNFCEKCRTPGF